MNIVVASVGVVVLLALALLVGASLDTEAQRVQWRRVADERRRRFEELRLIEELRHQVYEQRRRLREELRPATGPPGQQEICSRCPLHRLRDLGDEDE